MSSGIPEAFTGNLHSNAGYLKAVARLSSSLHSCTIFRLEEHLLCCFRCSCLLVSELVIASCHVL